MKISEALKQQRILSGHTQSSLSNATDISQQMISHWEADKGMPSIEFCIRLADFYGISIDELIGREIKNS